MNTISVTFPGGGSRELAWGTRVSELLEHADMPHTQHPIVAMLVNNELTSLSYKIEVNARLRPVTLEMAEGQRVYRRSLCFLLSMAVSRTITGRHAVIGHSLGDGYYYRFHDEKPVEQTEIDALKDAMHDLVEQDLPIVRRTVAYTDALHHFESHNMSDTALLVHHRNDSRIPVYSCGEFMDISHGPLVASTAILRYFDLVPYGSGFILRYPNEHDPYRLGEFQPSPLLFSIYQEYKQWGKVLSVASAGQLNNLAAETSKIRHFMQVAEALHDKKIAEIADRIHAQRDQVHIVLVAGPSSSGKTTFTKKLAVQLTVLGMKPVTIGLDDYFVSREETPRDEEGNYDFEHIGAIDIDLLNQNLLSLFRGEEVRIPSFDFKSGKRSYEGDTLQIPQRGIVLMEGIHGLNDRLTERIPADQKFKIYVSALTQLNLDDHNRVSTTDNRLIRRLVRDFKFRGHSALDTLHMWPQVRRGENRNIFPFQDSADAAFNSALDFELGVLRNQAWTLLNEIKPYHDVYHEALRLLSFLENFTTIPEKLVADFSILREFIGDSGFRY